MKCSTIVRQVMGQNKNKNFLICSMIVRQVMGQNKTEVNYSSPAEEYFQREVLEVHKSQGIAE